MVLVVRAFEIVPELIVAELYIVLGYAWYMGATNMVQVMAAHNRIAQAAKIALREAGAPDQRIYEKLQGIINEMGVEPSA